jgi:hypothetical protein
MLHEWIRVITEDDTTYVDRSIDNGDSSTTLPLALVAAEDAIYIGKQAPFNNFYYWANNAWNSAVDVLDGTALSGATLGRSGTVQFSPEINQTWTRITDTSDTSNTPTELRSLTIYNLYWLKITVSADLSAGTTANKIFYNFTDEQTVTSIDTDLSRYKTALSITDLTDKILLATKEILIKMKANRIVFDEGQVLRLHDFYLPTAYQVLVILLQDLGEDFNPKRELYIKKVNDFLQVENLSLDTNNNAFLEYQEYNVNQSTLVRT